ncbi:aromatic ring-hydroxylating dioxygenase subunit alpha [Solimonas marina]|uniref:Aromatic ring-hydroxylating dioxygenase subunit alpha n=1 Tax=Solimonas marina TaxID=2714601 RepID=A0A969WA30_9GAMM|nr:aromatic ring-hydroxylating dioxygenase subunit alpha [Solimonas marina]NKF23561.1 aromatic ring-hydroxylating dioxygenase subunit alpha [Solimonas marina]
MNRQDNELITRIGPGSAAGSVLRQYWQPAALIEELDGPRAVRPVTLLGESLVLFRDEQGRYGLVDRRCSHRGADLCYGRLENGGLRCPFHGWLFDVNGDCLEQPAEPEGSTLHERIRHRAYPCVERAGVIFAYMGEGEPPAFPDFDCFRAPDTHTFAFKGQWDCNWLQALEVGIDPAHASYLHRFFEDEDPRDSYGKQFRAGAAGTEIPLTQVLRDYGRPDIRVENTGYGFRLVTTRPLPAEQTHYRITNLAFPNAIAIPMSGDMTITQWHVPIDDTHCYWYAIFTSFGAPVDRATMRAQRLERHTLPDYRPTANRDNEWGYNADEQATQTYTGMGMDINVHDQWAVESQGAIQDRTIEHLGKTDVAIIANRRLLRAAIQARQQGEPLPFREPLVDADTGPVAVDAIGGRDLGEACWRALDRVRRAGASWWAKERA